MGHSQVDVTKMFSDMFRSHFRTHLDLLRLLTEINTFCVWHHLLGLDFSDIPHRFWRFAICRTRISYGGGVDHAACKDWFALRLRLAT